MVFYVSKIVGFVTLPSNMIGLLGAAGLLLLMLKWKRVGLFALASSIISLLLFGFSPLPNVLVLTLSERFPAWQSQGRDPDGMIVLGGGIEPNLSAARGILEINGAGDRLFAMLDLARRYPRTRIVYSGGNGDLIQNGPSEAPLAGRLLDDFGLTHGRVILESRSRTTGENASLTRQLVTPSPGQRWLLVTSALHMPRSIAEFRAAGFDVEAYPVDYGTRNWGDALQPFNKLSQGLARSDAAIHEWVGLVGLRLTGRSTELFPGPK